MNLRDLEYLVALSEVRHFRKAAEQCFVSQPTLSGQLKKLEKELGVQLVERTKHQVLMTPIGEEVTTKARQVLQEVASIYELVKTSGNPLSGPLKMGVIPTVAPYFLPLVVPDIHQKYEELQLFLHEVQTLGLLVQLEQGALDCGVLALPFESSKLEWITLYHEPFYLAVHPGHPMSKASKIKLQDLRQQTLLLLEDGHCLRDQALEVCAYAGAFENSSFRGTSLETLKCMVSSGNGMTLVPGLARQDSDNLVYLPFEDPAPSREIVLAYRKSSPRVEAYQAIASLITQNIHR